MAPHKMEMMSLGESRRYACATEHVVAQAWLGNDRLVAEHTTAREGKARRGGLG